MYVKHISRENFLKNSFKEASRVNELFLTEKNTMAINGRNIVGSNVQKYLYEKNIDSHLESVFKDLLLEGCIRSEVISGGSGDLCFSLAIKLFIHLNKKIKFYHPEELKLLLDNKEKKWIEIISKNRSPLEQNSFKKLLKSYFPDTEIRSFIKELVNISGCDNSIFINKSNKIVSTIKRDEGFIFNVGPSKNILNTVKSTKKKFTNIIVIDGIIEKTSEIHHILEKSSESGESFIIFCRDIKEEPLQTIKINLIRGTIDVIPIAVGIDENTLNILNDISICCNAELVSSLKGDLISASLSKAGNVERLELLDKKVILYNRDSVANVDSQIRYLKNKSNQFLRESTTNESLVSKDLIDNRIKALTSNKVEVNIGTYFQNKDNLIVEKIDSFLRLITASSTHGIIETNFKLDSKDEIDKIILQSFKENPVLTAVGAVQTVRITLSFLNNLFSIGGCLLNE